MLLPHKLKEQAAYLESNPDCSMVYGEGVYFQDGREVPVEYPPPQRGILRELLIRNYILVNAGLFRRDVIEKIGYFKERSQNRYPLYGCVGLGLLVADVFDGTSDHRSERCGCSQSLA